MNWEAIGAIGEIIGAAAVLVTLLYVAVQIRQNTKAIGSTNLGTWISATSAANSLQAQNAGFLSDAVDQKRDLSDAEQMRFHAQLAQGFNALEAVYLFHLAGTVDGAFFESKMTTAKAALGMPGIRSWWDAWARTSFDGRFVSHVESLV